MPVPKKRAKKSAKKPRTIILVRTPGDGYGAALYIPKKGMRYICQSWTELVLGTRAASKDGKWRITITKMK